MTYTTEEKRTTHKSFVANCIHETPDLGGQLMDDNIRKDVYQSGYGDGEREANKWNTATIVIAFLIGVILGVAI